MPFEAIAEKKSSTECIETITESLESQKLVENILKSRPDIVLEEVMQSKELSKTQSSQQTMMTVSQTSRLMNVSDATCCHKPESCELKPHTQFSPNNTQRKSPSKIDNAVPLKWESPLTQVIRTTEPDKDTFAAIPTKYSHSALASALVIAPSQPFTPSSTPIDPVPLPDETVPYLPPERPVILFKEADSQPKSKSEKTKSQFIKALEIVPELRCGTPVRGVPPPAKNKPKDPMDKYFKDLPKPQQKLSLLAALTTAPERAYSPLSIEPTEQLETNETDQSKEKQSEFIDKSKLIKPKKADVLPESFVINKKDPKPPFYYSQEKLYSKTEVTNSNENTEKTNTSKITTIEKQTTDSPQHTEVLVRDEEQNDHNFPPHFHGFSCSFQNKTDHSQFSVEINTRPPLRTPPPNSSSPINKTIEIPGLTQTRSITEEKHERQQILQLERNKEEIRTTAKQEENVVLKKVTPPVILRKADRIPQYQIQLEQEVKADLMILEHIQKAQGKMEERKSQQESISQQIESCNVLNPQPNSQNMIENINNAVQKPIIKIDSEDDQMLLQQRYFKPVTDQRPPSRTFSPRPTPSMINRPTPILPYYQANLVAQKISALEVNVFDPKSPALSRSPSPCPGVQREQSLSAFWPRESPRAVSPAHGPPPNPLQPTPTPRDSKMEKAREGLKHFIPEYKTKRDRIEQVQGASFKNLEESSRILQHTESSKQFEVETNQHSTQQPSQIYTSTVQTKNYPKQIQSAVDNEVVMQEAVGHEKGLYERKRSEMLQTDTVQQYCTQTPKYNIASTSDKQTKQAHLEQFTKSQSYSTQGSADRLTQEQRTKIVSEEYERTQKESKIETNVTSTKKYPFRDVNVSAVETPGISGMHLTNPQQISSPFLIQTNQLKNQETGQQQVKQQPVAVCEELQQKQKQYKPEAKCEKVCEKISLTQLEDQQLTTKQAQIFINQNKNTLAAIEPMAKTSSCLVKHAFVSNPLPPVKHVDPPVPSKHSNQNVIKPTVSQPNAGIGGGRQAGGISVAPRRGRGVLNKAAIGSARIPLCGSCNMHIR